MAAASKTAVHPPRAAASQHFLNVADIRDGILILRNGELRQVIEITSLNFALKSEEEQSAIIYQYQAFLNSLQFPIQILIQSRQLDLTRYLVQLQERMSQTTNLLMRNQIADYVDFISRLIGLGQIMEKRFYVTIPLATSAIRARSLVGQLFKKETVAISDQDFEKAKGLIADRTNTIVSGLSGMGLMVTPLTSDQLKRLLYTTYNPVEAGEVAPTGGLFQGAE